MFGLVKDRAKALYSWLECKFGLFSLFHPFIIDQLTPRGQYTHFLHCPYVLFYFIFILFRHVSYFIYIYVFISV